MLRLMREAMRTRTSSGTVIIRGLGLPAEDGDAGPEVGRGDIGGESALEAGAQPFLQGGGVGTAGGRRRGTICLPGVVQRKLNVEELLPARPPCR